MRGRSEHLLASVLFTDIVESSEVARDLGDRRWKVLLGRHHQLVRRALKRNRGKEVDNAGDGFFATFGDQVDAIRCACQIPEEVEALGGSRSARAATWARPRSWRTSSAA